MKVKKSHSAKMALSLRTRRAAKKLERCDLTQMLHYKRKTARKVRVLRSLCVCPASLGRVQNREITRRLDQLNTYYYPVDITHRLIEAILTIALFSEKRVLPCASNPAQCAAVLRLRPNLGKVIDVFDLTGCMSHNFVRKVGLIN